jgi:hypothetical protein
MIGNTPDGERRLWKARLAESTYIDTQPCVTTNSGSLQRRSYFFYCILQNRRAMFIKLFHHQIFGHAQLLN